MPWPDWGELRAGSAFAECEEEQLEAEDDEEEEYDEQANGEVDFVICLSPLELLLSTSRKAWQELSKRPGIIGLSNLKNKINN